MHAGDKPKLTTIEGGRSERCDYVNSDGSRCGQKTEHSHRCKWHQTSTSKGGVEIKFALQRHAMVMHLMEGYNLVNADLRDIDLVNHGWREGYKLINSDLYHADLRGAHLFRLDLSGSSLMKANFKGANLHNANLKDCNLLGAVFDKASLEGVEWGDKILQEKQAERESDPEEKVRLLSEAEEIYRNLRTVHDYQGHSHMAGVFFQREMTMLRLQLPKWSMKRLFFRFFDVFSGYGEEPIRVMLFSVVAILIYAGLYSLLGLQGESSVIRLGMGGLADNIQVFLDCLYFSVVTFTTLGYGDITPYGGSRLVAASQAFIGAFTIAVFVVMVVKKITR